MFNWSHSVKLGNHSQVKRVQDTLEISDLLKTTTSKVKVLGSGMSYPPIGQASTSNDILLDMSQMAGFISLNGSVAQFHASTLMGDIVNYLNTQKLQLICCPGVLLTQTAAGALSTGTHGQGIVNAGLYDAVVEIEVVHADGSINTFKRGDAAFDAYRLHLGVLGILTKISFQCEPLVVYKQIKEISDFKTMVDQYQFWNESSEHAKAWWFPETDKVQLWTTVKASKSESEEYFENGSQIQELKTNAKNDEYSLSLRQLVNHMEKDTKAIGEKITTAAPNVPGGRFETVLRFEAQDARIGNMYQLWCKGIPAPQVNSEIAIPMRRLKEALECLHYYYKTEKPALHYPFILRATGASSAWLSPSAGEKVCYIGFLVYLSEDTFNGNQERLQHLSKIETLLSKFEAIPHYGKFFTIENYDFGKLLPRWNDFKTLRDRVDPTGRFLNPWLKKFLSISDTREIQCRL